MLTDGKYKIVPAVYLWTPYPSLSVSITTTALSLRTLVDLQSDSNIVAKSFHGVLTKSQHVDTRSYKVLSYSHKNHPRVNSDMKTVLTSN
jgi:hypothetical protein